ncbi:MAG: T9SS type A sorting domain-containing protein, partial [Lentimicrobiaceae bacterium]|nr:T9SS type A sorting domain-containing protein [Lentimicrobiaceae bacterium]
RYEKGIDIITDDPLFVNPAPLAGINVNGWEYDWRLRNDSPAINAGSSQTYYGYELPEFDFEGNPRVAGSVDIGCYENQTVIGINENKMSGLVTIYPNPFHNSFKIKLNKGEAVAQISIYNATGATVAKQQITSESNEVMLENVPSGLYFLSVETPNGNRTTTKIVKE